MPIVDNAVLLPTVIMCISEIVSTNMAEIVKKAFPCMVRRRSIAIEGNKY